MTDLRKGSTRLLVLSLLAEGPMYGYQIAKELERRSEGYFDFKEGTLYPLLHLMEKQGLVKGEWRVVEKGPPRKYYGLTQEGRRGLEESAAEWTIFSQHLLRVLEREAKRSLP